MRERLWMAGSCDVDVLINQKQSLPPLRWTPHSNSYNFRAEMTSTVSTKIVPAPPPPILEERIRILMDQERVAG